MAIHCNCPDCYQDLTFDDYLAGTQIRCKYCRAVMIVPRPSATSPLAGPSTPKWLSGCPMCGSMRYESVRPKGMAMFYDRRCLDCSHIYDAIVHRLASFGVIVLGVAMLGLGIMLVFTGVKGAMYGVGALVSIGGTVLAAGFGSLRSGRDRSHPAPAPPPPPVSSGNSEFWITTLIILGVLLLVGGIIGAAIYFHDPHAKIKETIINGMKSRGVNIKSIEIKLAPLPSFKKRREPEPAPGGPFRPPPMPRIKMNTRSQEFIGSFTDDKGDKWEIPAAYSETVAGSRDLMIYWIWRPTEKAKVLDKMRQITTEQYKEKVRDLNLTKQSDRTYKGTITLESGKKLRVREEFVDDPLDIMVYWEPE